MDFTHNYDNKGRLKSVLVPAKAWVNEVEPALKKYSAKRNKKKQEDEYVPRTKQEILDGISRAVEEVKLIRAGKLKAKTLREVLDEL